MRAHGDGSDSVLATRGRTHTVYQGHSCSQPRHSDQWHWQPHCVCLSVCPRRHQQDGLGSCAGRVLLTDSSCRRAVFPCCVMLCGRRSGAWTAHCDSCCALRPRPPARRRRLHLRSQWQPVCVRLQLATPDPRCRHVWIACANRSHWVVHWPMCGRACRIFQHATRISAAVAATLH